jgi:hypothetical protein
MAPNYDPEAVYDDEAMGFYLRAMIARCPEVASDAALALGMNGVTRQIYFDSLVIDALRRDVWTPDERAVMSTIVGTGMLNSRPERRSVPIQIMLTPSERSQLGGEANSEGLTLSDLIRQRMLGAAPRRTHSVRSLDSLIQELATCARMARNSAEGKTPTINIGETGSRFLAEDLEEAVGYLSVLQELIQASE